MISFETLYNEYEKTHDVCKFYEKYKNNDISIRFLLVRSLDKNSLKEIVGIYSDENAEGKMEELTKKAYNSHATISDLVEYIEGKRSQIIAQREEELQGLPEVLASMPIENCGVRDDKIDNIVKEFVRDKSLKSVHEIERKLDEVVIPRIRQYSLWSYYNQTANDIIELAFLKHTAVIPTLRKIPNIDFFVKIGEEIIPFDLKFTHISNDYFDLASKGIIKNDDSIHYDEFKIERPAEKDETKQLKDYYKEFKRKHRNLNIPNVGHLGKNDICSILLSTRDEDAVRFVAQMKAEHRKYIPINSNEFYPLEWWNYKFQGERLFCNNNRIFVFLAYLNKMVDGRDLKGKTKEICSKISELLDGISMDEIHLIKYHYDKESQLIGDYSALAVSTIYCE